MERLTQQYDLQIRWHSFELQPPGAPPMPPDLQARIEAGRPRFATMAREQYGLEVHPGPFGIDSRPALIGEQFALAQGHGTAFHDAVATAYWQHAQRIDEPQVLAELGASVGLDRAQLLAALADERYAAAVDADMAWAQTHGLTGVPALVFNDTYLVVGAQPYALLEQVVQRCQAEGAG